MRTLPLSASAVILGLVMAFVSHGLPFDAPHLVCALSVLLTAIMLQILSNYANDLGDQISGVDKTHRKGRISMVQQGLMTIRELKVATAVIAALTLLCGLASVCACWWGDWAWIGAFLLLGALAAGAAVGYTMGPSYSYLGLGDLFVFIFFGLVAVAGSEFMLAHATGAAGLLAGAGAGFSSIMVLNVNNLRDYLSDIEGGKKSLVVRMGLDNGRRYHLALFLLCLASAASSACLILSWHGLLILPFFVPLLKAALYASSSRHEGAALEPAMKATSLSASLVNVGLALLMILASCGVLPQQI